jgi:selenium metabolism protein YedF
MSKHVLIVSDRVGSGDAELGKVLMRNLLYAFARNPQPPASVMFMNEGVRLACSGSTSLDDLKLLVEQGVSVRACGTCLDYLGLTAELAVGEIGSMNDSVATLLGDNTVLTIA